MSRVEAGAREMEAGEIVVDNGFCSRFSWNVGVSDLGHFSHSFFHGDLRLCRMSSGLFSRLGWVGLGAHKGQVCQSMRL